MSLPHILLVDDSEAILAFEQAALAGLYHTSTATSGRDALEKIARVRPACVLLDLSMPEMDGDEVFARLREDPELKEIPVVVISSERERGERLLEAGAEAFLPKPVSAEELVEVVARVLDDVQRNRRRGNLAVLFAEVGGIAFGLPLDRLVTVVFQTSTRPLVGGPSYMSEFFDLWGEPVPVLDLARRLALENLVSVLDRKFVVIVDEGARLALRVDSVTDPEDVPAADVFGPKRLAKRDHGLLDQSLIAVVRTARGLVPVVDPHVFVSPSLISAARATLRNPPVPEGAGS